MAPLDRRQLIQCLAASAWRAGDDVVLTPAGDRTGMDEVVAVSW